MKIGNEHFERIYLEFLDMLNDDPDFNYSIYEFEDWVIDYYPELSNLL